MNQDEIEKMSYEEAMSALQALVTAAEEDDLSLERLIDNYSRGQALINRCRTLLADAELKLQKLDVKSGRMEVLD